MLKIKKHVNLDVLEEYGFEKSYNSKTGKLEIYNRFSKLYDGTFMWGSLLPSVNVNTRKLHCNDDELLFDLIELGIVEKVEE